MERSKTSGARNLCYHGIKCSRNFACKKSVFCCCFNQIMALLYQSVIETSSNSRLQVPGRSSIFSLLKSDSAAARSAQLVYKRSQEWRVVFRAIRGAPRRAAPSRRQLPIHERTEQSERSGNAARKWISRSGRTSKG